MDLFQDIRDVAGPILNITNLDGSTEYTATVTTVFHEVITDSFVESPESQPSVFTTGNKQHLVKKKDLY